MHYYCSGNDVTEGDCLAFLSSKLIMQNLYSNKAPFSTCVQILLTVSSPWHVLLFVTSQAVVTECAWLGQMTWQ